MKDERKCELFLYPVGGWDGVNPRNKYITISEGNDQAGIKKRWRDDGYCGMTMGFLGFKGFDCNPDPGVNKPCCNTEGRCGACPSTAQAAPAPPPPSCISNGHSCSYNGQCCSKICNSKTNYHLYGHRAAAAKGSGNKRTMAP